MAEYCHWRDYEKSLQLAIHLRGTAQGVLADLRQDQRTNFTSLISALAARFEPVQQSELHHVKLKTPVRREGETLPELAQDVNKLIRLAYPSATAGIREQLSRDCFIDALNDPDLEWTVLQGKPNSVEHALKLALEYEAFLVGRRDGHVDSKHFNPQQQGRSQDSNSGPPLLSRVTNQLRDPVPIQSYCRVSAGSQTQSSTDMRQWLEAKSTDDIIREQNQDPKISTVIGWKSASTERPNWERVSHFDPDHKSYWSPWNRLIVKDDILYRRWICEKTGRDHLELVVPDTWRNEIIKMFHADPGAGHMGVKRTVERIRTRAYWLRMTETVKRFCEKVRTMSKEEKSSKKSKSSHENICQWNSERARSDRYFRAVSRILHI